MAPNPWPDELPPCAEPLENVLGYVMGRLSAGVGQRANPYRVPTLASVGGDGAPNIRTVVLRAFDEAARVLLIYTDRRTPKFAELGADQRAALHVYDPAANVQVRLWGAVSLHLDDEVADSAWAATGPGQIVNYATDPAPGVVVNAPPALPDASPAQARRNFAVLRFRFEALEFLWLSRAGHWRARFEWRGERLSAHWQMP
jgi:hypothetical protein